MQETDVSSVGRALPQLRCRLYLLNCNFAGFFTNMWQLKLEIATHRYQGPVVLSLLFNRKARI